MAVDVYRKRVVDGELAERLSAIGAVLIEGPKACGKTESAIQKATTTHRLDVDSAARNAASVAPDLLLDSPTPVLLDEWQVVPTLWDQVRRAVDDRAPAKGYTS
jgi:predicted AAA+ superfamily ATPase